MINRLHVLALTLSIGLLLGVLELVRRRKLTEEYSFLWIVFAVALVVLSVRYPSIGLVLLLIPMVVVASIYHSVIVSRQRQQIERLIEETAILSAELRDLRANHTRSDALSRKVGFRADAETPGEVVASTARDRTDPRR